MSNPAPGLQPVKMNGKCNIGHNEVIKHMRLAFYRKLPQLYKREAHNGEAVLVGTGPSVEGDVEKIRELRDKGCIIFAIKGAHDFLLDHGIRPHFAIAVDGQEKIAKLYQNPQPDCVYLIASQCHPKTFDALQGQNIIVWNCYTDKAHKHWQAWLKKKRKNDKIFFVQGGSTSGMRCVTIAYLMGFRKLNMFGYDSCLGVPAEYQEKLDKGEVTEVPKELQSLKITGEKNEKELLVAVVEGHKYFCDPAMALQGNEFLPQINGIGQSGDPVRVRVYGSGFIPTANRYSAMRGHPWHLFPDEDWDKMDHPDRGTLKEEAPPPQNPFPNVGGDAREVVA